MRVRLVRRLALHIRTGRPPHKLIPSVPRGYPGAKLIAFRLALNPTLSFAFSLIISDGRRRSFCQLPCPFACSPPCTRTLSNKLPAAASAVRIVAARTSNSHSPVPREISTSIVQAKHVRTVLTEELRAASHSFSPR